MITTKSVQAHHHYNQQGGAHVSSTTGWTARQQEQRLHDTCMRTDAYHAKYGKTGRLLVPQRQEQLYSHQRQCLGHPHVHCTSDSVLDAHLQMLPPRLPAAC